MLRRALLSWLAGLVGLAAGLRGKAAGKAVTVREKVRRAWGNIPVLIGTDQKKKTYTVGWVAGGDSDIDDYVARMRQAAWDQSTPEYKQAAKLVSDMRELGYEGAGAGQQALRVMLGLEPLKSKCDHCGEMVTGDMELYNVRRDRKNNSWYGELWCRGCDAKWREENDTV